MFFCLPALHRLVEAICIRLCNNITKPRKETGISRKNIYTSRWKLKLLAYINVRSRLMNSQALLKGTNVVLFNIKEATLVRWYKNTTRRDEIKQLMQGLSTPLATMSTASETLPPPVKHPSTPLSCPPEPHSFSEPEDTTGQVRVRKTSLPPSLSAAKSSTARASEAYSSSPIALRTFDVRL